jgi:transcriptional regulator with XRE-family HTH domain
LHIFAKRLEALIQKPLTQQIVADGVGVSQPTVQRWLKGTIPGGEELLKLANFLGVDPYALLYENRPPPAKLLRDIPAESLVDDVLAEMDNLKEQIAALDRTVRRLKTKSQISSGTNPGDRTAGEISYGGGGSKKQRAPDHER